VAFFIFLKPKTAVLKTSGFFLGAPTCRSGFWSGWVVGVGSGRSMVWCAA
jgi:hypothetical protein